MEGRIKEFLHILSTRGFLNQLSNEQGIIDYLHNSSSSGGYIGFDITAPSLHIGSLLPIMMLKWFGLCGHRPIVVLGGATTKIGDPSGKDKTRQILTNETIDANISSISNTFEKVLGNEVLVINNENWLKNLNYIDFLRKYAKHFSVNKMLALESVKQRLNRQHHLSFLEFNYMIFQAYDFLHLYEEYGCQLQMGGSDQWGNIISGIDLINHVTGNGAFGLTCPLITTADGKKMGKSENGAIWLNEQMLSIYDYWQFWRNTKDADVQNFLKLFTMLPLDEIARLAKLEGDEINEAKIILATQATTILYSKQQAEEIRDKSQKIFQKTDTSAIKPAMTISLDTVKSGFPLISALVNTKLCQSNSQARRFIKADAIKLNNEKITDLNYIITTQNINSEHRIHLSLGKKKHSVIAIKP